MSPDLWKEPIALPIKGVCHGHGQKRVDEAKTILLRGYDMILHTTRGGLGMVGQLRMERQHGKRKR